MSDCPNNKRSWNDQIDFNNVDNNARDTKQRKHLTTKSDTNEKEDAPNSDWKPSNWEKKLQDIREMSKNIIAPVDYMGFNKAADSKVSIKVSTHTHTS